MKAVKNSEVIILIFYKTCSINLGYVNVVILDYDTAILPCLACRGVLIPSEIQAIGIF